MRFFHKAIITSALTLALSSSLNAEEVEADQKQIQSVLETYETALNKSDVELAVSVYTEDGVFMPQHNLPSTGKEAIKAAYSAVFSAITLDIEFIVDEVQLISPEWAFARTRSEGFVTINANGHKNPEANQELFLFRKLGDGSWKIARYIFSTTNAPQQN